MEKKTDSKKTKNFEDALFKLEEIAKQLETGELGLEDSIKGYEDGVLLAKYCREKLDEAERKIEILQKGKTKSVSKKEVKIKENTGEIEDDENLQGSLL